MLMRRSLGVAARGHQSQPEGQPEIRNLLGQYVQKRQEVKNQMRAGLAAVIEGQAWMDRFDPVAERAMGLLTNQERD